jgi:heme/copper-type cytochrome/quinol oxidase subunit 3
MEASPPRIEPEPAGWQPRALWVSARLWCGAVSFFFVSFLFAYFYLRSLDPNHGWKIGHVGVPGGLGVAVMSLMLLSGILLRIGTFRPADTVSTGVVSIVLAIVAIVLQFYEYTTLGFGPASGAFASVFIGWTATYVMAAICGLYWIETQVATLWRAGRQGADDQQLAVMRAGLEGCSFFWAYFVGIGVIMYVVLYLV